MRQTPSGPASGKKGPTVFTCQNPARGHFRIFNAVFRAGIKRKLHRWAYPRKISPASWAAYFGAPDGQGVLVTDVHMGSAGEKAGLKAGDVITKLDGERVHNVGELRTQLRAKREANTVTLSIIRKGSEMSLTATPEKPQSRRSGNGDSLIPL